MTTIQLPVAYMHCIHVYAGQYMYSRLYTAVSLLPAHVKNCRPISLYIARFLVKNIRV